MSKKINYEDLVQNALVSVVRDLLKETAEKGLLGHHHFYVSYNTDHPDVELPDYLREQYPESITIVIQYDFWDLKVFEDRFEVTLSFNGVSEYLVVPFAAMTSFVDPSAKFGLQFTPSHKGAGQRSSKKLSKDDVSSSAPHNKFDIPKEAIDGNVISFDAFRKKQ